MLPEQVKAALHNAVLNVSNDISKYSVAPEKDFTRKRKITADKLMWFLIDEGASTTNVELTDFRKLFGGGITASAMNQQRAKLKPEALLQVLQGFDKAVRDDARDPLAKYNLYAADGSTCTYFSNPELSGPEYHASQGDAQKGSYSMHLTALWNMDTHTYADAVIQPVHEKDEFSAFCTLVDRMPSEGGKTDILDGDRGFCSYNNMAHVAESGKRFLFRSKDIGSKGIASNFDHPETDCFDIDVTVTITRSHSKAVRPRAGTYVRFIGAETAFDYVEYGSTDTYELSFRFVRLAIPGGSHECLLTNLPRDEFGPNVLKELYNRRWGIETSFRKLKHTIGLSNFHSCKPTYVMQEIYARMVRYNATEAMIFGTPIEEHGTRHAYKVNFQVAAHTAREFLRSPHEGDAEEVMIVMKQNIIPERKERHYPRLQTAHFRRPRYFTYRAA